MKYKELRDYSKHEGWFLFLIFLTTSILNKIASYLLSFSGKFKWPCAVVFPFRIVGGDKIQVGKNFYAGRGLWLEVISFSNLVDGAPRLKIGDNVSLNEYVHVAAKTLVEIGSGTLIASNVFISDHNHGVYAGPFQSDPNEPPAERKLTDDRKVKIGEKVWIGNNVCILPGSEIGDGAIIGANSVVNGIIPGKTIAVGTPAKVIKRFNASLKTWERAGTNE